MAGAAEPGTPPTAAERAAAPDAGAMLNILPPGSDGVYTSADVAQQQGGQQPPNTVDQLQMYDALNKLKVGDLTEARLTDFFKEGSLGVDPADVVATLRPREGTTILRDKFGVPHIYGTTYSNVAYGAGYAGTQDRMFLQDALRHAGDATLPRSSGPRRATSRWTPASCARPPTPSRRPTTRSRNIVKRYPDEAPRILAAIDDFIKGINDAQRALCPAGPLAGAVLPGRVRRAADRARGLQPRRHRLHRLARRRDLRQGWRRTSTTTRCFLRKLRAKFGATEAAKIYADLPSGTTPRRR